MRLRSDIALLDHDASRPAQIDLVRRAYLAEISQSRYARRALSALTARTQRPRTVYSEHHITRAITLIGMPWLRCKRPIGGRPRRRPRHCLARVGVLLHRTLPCASKRSSLTAFRRQGSIYEPSPIRTHVTSRMGPTLPRIPPGDLGVQLSGYEGSRYWGPIRSLDGALAGESTHRTMGGAPVAT